MPKVSRLPTSKSAGDYAVIATFTPVSIGSAVAKALSGFSAKAVAQRLRKVGAAVSSRTVEVWKQARRTPRAEHVFAMLTDDELSALVLAEVNPGLAIQAEILATKKKLKKLEERQ